MWPLDGTNPPPNTAQRNKRRKVNFDFPLGGGAKNALQWGGDDLKDRETIRQRPRTPGQNPSYITKPGPKSILRNPDHSTYISSWSNTIPNKTSKTFTMNDTILLPTSRTNGAQTPRRPISRGITPTKLNQYSEVPAEIERQKSNLHLKPAVNPRRPGILDTINAADHAIRHIQVKKDKEDENYQYLIDFHRRRYDDAQEVNNNYVRAAKLERSRALSLSDPALTIDTTHDWNNWRSKISKAYKEQYMDILERYKHDHKNPNSGFVKNFYKNNEGDLATKIDLRRFHHAI